MKMSRWEERVRISPAPLEQSYRSILIEVLKMALEPQPLKMKIGSILDYLLSLHNLQLSGKAALFLVDQPSQTLYLLVNRGFSEYVGIACNESRFDLCHCGRVAEQGKPQFFRTPPPLATNSGTADHLFGNYCTPIAKDGQRLGVLTVYVNRDHSWSPETEGLLEAIANILAVTIENQQMDQQLIQLVNDLRTSIINLREEKKFSESIIQGLNHGLIVVDLEGRIRKSNSVAKNIFRPFTTQLEGQFLVDFLGESTAKQFLATLPSKPNQLDRELTLITPTREKRIIGFSNVPQEDARGRKIGVIISLSDISELKYVRKEMEKMNRLSTIAEIASAVAHEVRNPLAGIKIMAQSIEEEAKENSEQLECSRRIIRQVDRLNELLSDFFSYARPAEPNKRPTSLHAIVAETNPLIHNRLTKNHIELVEDISPDLPPIIADPHQVQQVFLNLFLNAVDAIKAQGKIEISARFLPKSRVHFFKKRYPGLENKNYVVVHFSDNGMGMAPEVAEQVFEPFFTTKTSGAGLGLSIVYRTLKENDATIVLESKPGKGATFVIFFRTGG